MAELAGWLHFEIAYTPVLAVHSLILDDLLPHATSVGLNEVELGLFAKDIFADYQETDACDVTLKRFHAAIAQRAGDHPAPAIFFHTAGLYCSVDTSNRVDHAAFAASAARAEAIIIKSRSTPESKPFEKPVDFAATLCNACPECGIPEGAIFAHYPKLIAPITSTVGLGDTISSALAVGMML
eukprot:gnl/Ergobibamus_cyprinoides/623.p2 GENE.gnl/Ergobibamus_cyprinoides/623~~gnl/Ergobibamus_cyprinoides/623.p2  ORF type:complete len:183 (+),score=88.04 gnl/Ergobibamus_cyprinoides/623:721-1269(+)